MKKIKIAYYVVTVILSLFIVLPAYFDIIAAPAAKDIIVHLGYPVYLLYIVGWAKVFGIIGIWQTKIHFLREWAYAGLMIDVAGALCSHLFVGDPISMYVPAVIGIILVTTSYILFRKFKSSSSIIAKTV